MSVGFSLMETQVTLTSFSNDTAVTEMFGNGGRSVALKCRRVMGDKSQWQGQGPPMSHSDISRTIQKTPALLSHGTDKGRAHRKYNIASSKAVFTEVSGGGCVTSSMWTEHVTPFFSLKYRHNRRDFICMLPK